MIYDGYKLYGPYQRQDGRFHVILKNGERRFTVSFPKYLMELHLNRYLKEDETIDHIDGNFNNNNINNLQILSRSEHSSLDVKKIQSEKFICELCNKEFILSGRKLHDAYHNRKKGKAGPFCSRSCAGKASHNIKKYEKKQINYKLKSNKEIDAPVAK